MGNDISRPKRYLPSEHKLRRIREEKLGKKNTNRIITPEIAKSVRDSHPLSIHDISLDESGIRKQTPMTGPASSLLDATTSGSQHRYPSSSGAYVSAISMKDSLATDTGAGSSLATSRGASTGRGQGNKNVRLRSVGESVGANETVDSYQYAFASPTLMGSTPQDTLLDRIPAPPPSSTAIAPEESVKPPAMPSVRRISVSNARALFSGSYSEPHHPASLPRTTLMHAPLHPPNIHSRLSIVSATGVAETSNTSFSGIFLHNSVLPLSTTTPTAGISAATFPMPIFAPAHAEGAGDYEMICNANLSTDNNTTGATNSGVGLTSNTNPIGDITNSLLAFGRGGTQSSNQTLFTLSSNAALSDALRPSAGEGNDGGLPLADSDRRTSISDVTLSLPPRSATAGTFLRSVTDMRQNPFVPAEVTTSAIPRALQPDYLAKLGERYHLTPPTAAARNNFMDSDVEEDREDEPSSDGEDDDGILSHSTQDALWESWSVVRRLAAESSGGHEVVLKRFYHLLFEKGGDHIRKLFAYTDKYKQENMLSAVVLWALGQNFNNEKLQRLGVLHAHMGVSREDLRLFAECFLETIREYSGHEWLTSHEDAWLEVFRKVVEVMGDVIEETEEALEIVTRYGEGFHFPFNQNTRGRHPSLGFHSLPGPLLINPSSNGSFDSNALIGSAPAQTSQSIFTTILASRRSSLGEATTPIHQSADPFMRVFSGTPALGDSQQSPTPPHFHSPGTQQHQQLDSHRSKLVKWFQSCMLHNGCPLLSVQVDNIFGSSRSSAGRSPSSEAQSKSPTSVLSPTIDVDSVTADARVAIGPLEPALLQYGFCRPPFMPQVWEYTSRMIELHGRILYVNLPDGSPSIVVDLKKALSVERADSDPANHAFSPFTSPQSRGTSPSVPQRGMGGARIRVHGRQSSEASTNDGTVGSLGLGSGTMPSLILTSRQLGGRQGASHPNAVATPKQDSPETSPVMMPYHIHQLTPSLTPAHQPRHQDRRQSLNGTPSNPSSVQLPHPPLPFSRQPSEGTVKAAATDTHQTVSPTFTIRIDSHDGSLIHFLNFRSQTLCERWMVLLRRHHQQFSSYATAPALKDLHVITDSAFNGAKPLAFEPSDFEYLTLIGKGNYGKVVKVMHKATSKIYAMKIIQKTAFTHMRNVVEVRRERAILETVNSPFIVKFFGFFQSEERLYFLFDFLSGGELFYHTKCAPSHHFTEDTSRFYLAEIACALEHLRLRNIVHRDIKGDNFVLDADGHVVLTDFGFAKAVDKAKRNTATCGTLAYIAPEVLAPGNSGYGYEVDWWSLGVVLFTMLTGFFPFLRQSPPETAKAIVYEQLRFPATVELTHNARSLCRRLMHKNPQERITSLQALQGHPFFAGFDWEKLIHRQLTPPFVPDATGTNTKYFNEALTKTVGAAAAPPVEDPIPVRGIPEETNVFSSIFDEHEQISEIQALSPQ